MNKNFALILSLIVLIISCKESTTEPPPNVTSSDYFPNSDGNYYYYNISADDSSGLVQSGTRKSYYSGDTTLLLTPYQIKVDTFQINVVQSILNSYFRKSESGIFYSLDTTGFSSFVPDSLLGSISFSLEYRILFQPLEIFQTWPVFKVQVNVIQFDVFTIDAQVISKQKIDLTLNDSTVSKDVFTIRYTAKLTTSLNQPPITFTAIGEIAEGIGFIRWEGDSEIINFFAGRNIYLPGTYVIEELSSYKSQ
jgi:hypothetical protein